MKLNKYKVKKNVFTEIQKNVEIKYIFWEFR